MRMDYLDKVKELEEQDKVGEEQLKKIQEENKLTF